MEMENSNSTSPSSMDLYDKDLSIKIRSGVSEAFKEISETLRQEHFEPIFQISNVSVHKDYLINYMKKRFLEKIEQDFDVIWKSKNIAFDLNTLETLKKEYSTDLSKKWRPTNHTPEEQIFPIVLSNQSKKIKFLEKIIKQKESEIEKLCENITKKRIKFNEIDCLEKRVQEHIIQHETEFEKNLEEIQDIKYKALAELCDNKL